MFSEIKTTMEPEFINSHGSASDGTSGNLDEIIETVENYTILKDFPQIKERFWDMFIVDALIGNNGNWGILVYKDHIDMIPIYDNGRLCFHSINGKKINPYHYIMKMENEDCNKAVEHIFPNISLDKINDIIEDVYKAGLFSDTVAKFYRTIMYERYAKVLEPVYSKIKERNVDTGRTE